MAASIPRASSAELPDHTATNSPIFAVFKPDGLLARHLPSYRFRPQQLAMAESIAEAITQGTQLIAEAGTGTGKTFAYLVPALLSGGKVIISTGTKTLQDQLFQRDLPLVRDALRVPVTLALLKGRANYVCRYYLARVEKDGQLASRADVGYLRKIVSFANVSVSGDKAQLADVPENAAIWSQVTSTRDNCLGSNCPNYRDCFVMTARKEALQADVVVINHHLFFADVMLRDEGLSELLPACNTVILDEAHQLSDTATLFFGEQLTAGQLAELARDSEAAALSEARDYAALPQVASDLANAVRKVRLAAGETPGKRSQVEVASYPDFMAALAELAKILDQLSTALQTQAERGEQLELCRQRATDATLRLARWRAGFDVAEDPQQLDWVRWLDVLPNGWQLHAAPLSVAEIFHKQVVETARSWIFTSATLAVGTDFSHYQRELGLAQAATGYWESPFDYSTQALLYLPSGLPQPNQPEHTEAVIRAAIPVLKASKGRAFILFTTLRALRQARQLLEAAFEVEELDYPLLVQGEGTRSDLLSRFRLLGNAVLLGSQSFWEGVDVQGEALSVVIIDKLPFAPPDDPVLAARLTRISREGRSPFFDYQLPQAVISLKQGAGRLIRSETDRGVLMIGDPRLVEKSYGRKIWQSLPPMRRTRELSEVEQFFAP